MDGKTKEETMKERKMKGNKKGRERRKREEGGIVGKKAGKKEE